MLNRPPTVGFCHNQSVDAAGNQLVIAAHRTTRSRAIGSSFVSPKKAAISKSDKVAPPIVSALHQLNGTQIPTTARAARKNSIAALTARKNPESGKPEDAVTWPNGPLSPSLQGQAHLNSLPNSPWASLSRGQGTKPQSAPAIPKAPRRATSTSSHRLLLVAP